MEEVLPCFSLTCRSILCNRRVLLCFTTNILEFIECVNGENIRWIVDYKLSISGEKLDLPVAAEQHRPQLARYESLFVGEGWKIKTAVLFLSSGELFVL